MSDAEPYAFEVEPTEINLGVLRPDEAAKCEFWIVNRDARPLDVVNLDGSCECVGFQWERGLIPPEGRRKVATTIYAENRGNKLLTAFVQANDRVATTREVGIRYVVRPDLLFEPAQVDFGRRVVGGGECRQSVTVRYQLPEGVDPLAFAPTIPPGVPLTVHSGEAALVPLGGGIRDVRVPLEVILDAREAVAPFKGDLLFESSRHATAKLRVTGSVHAGAYLEPEELHLGVMASGESRRGAARVRFTRDQLAIESIETSVPDLVVQESSESSGRSWKLNVTFTAAQAGDFEGSVTVRTSASPTPLLLRIRAKVR